MTDMGVRENLVLGHTDLKRVRQTCQSNDLIKKLFQNIRGKRTKVMQIDIIHYIKIIMQKRRQNSKF